MVVFLIKKFAFKTLFVNNILWTLYGNMFKVYKVYFKKGLERHDQTRLLWFEAEESVVVCSPAKYIPTPLSPSC